MLCLKVTSCATDWSLYVATQAEKLVKALSQKAARAPGQAAEIGLLPESWVKTSMTPWFGDLNETGERRKVHSSGSYCQCQ